MTEESPSIADSSEFRRLLHAGLGRVILFLQTHDSTPYHDIIVDACLHHPAYDKQSEGTRGKYMLDLLHATRDMQIYRRTVLDALHASLEDEDADDYDDDHLCSIARWLAEEGDQEARDALYEFVTAALEYGGETGADEVVALDGIKGFTYVVAIVDQRTHFDIDSEFFYGGWYTYALRDKYGEERATALLQEAAEQNEIVAAYLQAVAWNDARQERNREKRANRPYENYSVLQGLIKDNAIKGLHGRLRRWGRQATDDDLARAATDLLEAQEDEQILNYLNIFRLRAFPLDPSRLLALTESDDETIVAAAYSALEEIHHPMVRAHALQLLAASRRPPEAVDLLTNNFEEGDHLAIEQVLRQPLADDDVHSIGHSVLAVIKKRKQDEDPTERHSVLNVIKKRIRDEDSNMLLLLYDREPCSFCREYIIGALIALSQMPHWMIAECRYDSNQRIRAMIKEMYGSGDHLPEHRKP